MTDRILELGKTDDPHPPRLGRSAPRSGPLAQLDTALRACHALDPASLALAASNLAPEIRTTLARRAKDASRRLSLASDEIAR